MADFLDKNCERCHKERHPSCYMDDTECDYKEIATDLYLAGYRKIYPKNLLVILNIYDSGYSLSIAICDQFFKIIDNIENDICRQWYDNQWEWDINEIRSYLMKKYGNDINITFLSFSDGSLDKDEDFE